MAEEETIVLYRRKDGSYASNKNKITYKDAVIPEQVYSLEQLQTLSINEGDLVFSEDSNAPKSITIKKALLAKTTKDKTTTPVDFQQIKADRAAESQLKTKPIDKFMSLEELKTGSAEGNKTVAVSDVNGQVSALDDNGVPTAAVILTGNRANTVRVVDINTAQREFITQIINLKMVGEYKELLIKNGMYAHAGIGGQDIAESLRNKDVVDEKMKQAISVMLYDIGNANYYAALDGKEVLWNAADYSKIAMPPVVERQISLPSEGTAQELLRTKFLQYVGRAPNADEIAAFQSVIGDFANKNASTLSTSPGLTGNTSISQAGYTQADLDKFAEDYTLEQDSAQEFAKGQGGVEMFGSAMRKYISSLAPTVQNINKI
jgi:hypothetical protein